MTMISYKDSIEYLKSLKHQIGQSQHRDLWHFEQAIDEIIELLKPLATPHGRLIDADEIEKCVHEWYDVGEYVFADTIRNTDTIIEAEVSE